MFKLTRRCYIEFESGSEDVMRTKINNAIKSVLKQFDKKYFIGEVVNKNKVIQDLHSYNKELLTAFIRDEVVNKNFTFDIEGNKIVQINKLIELFEVDEYWQDSYTKFSKRIGLTSVGKFINESTDVVLNFPYKDTILKASMSKEDSDKKSLRPDEPFLNEILAKEEIDVLLDKKILVSAKKYDVNGVHDVDQFHEKDNLIIKGNNLLALYTLKEKFAGKIKLIYIDPPYNTGGDSFLYNDRFNHSSWLTFMKNRLEIAKELLREDGLIFVQCDFNESHYLKVLMDDIFGSNFFVNDIIWKRKFGNANETRRLGTAYDNILLYSKSENYLLNPVREKNSNHVQEYIKKRFTRSDNSGPNKGRLWMPYPLANPGKPTKNLIYEYKGYKPPAKGWRMVKEKLEKLDIEGRIYFPKDKNQRLQEKKFLDEYEGQPVDSLWTDIFVINSQAKEALDFDGQKPEHLIRRILSLGSAEGDIVLDFFMGSASTQATAHKMKRQYIGIEQMDYMNTVSVPRLQKVIDGEQGGISKEVEWNDGGSFVYVELMEKNRGFLTSIQKAETVIELRNILTFMLEEAEIDFRVDLEKIKGTIHELSFEDQKKTLIKIVDKNQLYYNYSEIDDENVRDLISETDYNFNNNFYKNSEK